MNDNIQLFIIDEDGNLIINKNELTNIPEYRNILNRKNKDKTKYKSFQELLFIYLMMNPNSMYMDLPEADRMARVIAHCGFEDTWTPDLVVLDAMERYREDLKLDALIYAYHSSRQGIYAMSSDINLIGDINEGIRTKIKEDKAIINSDEYNEMDKQEARLRLQNNTDLLINNNEKVMKLNDKYPKALDTTEILYKKMINKRDEDSKVYGGGKLGNREE